MASYHGLQFAGTPGLLMAMLKLEATNLCTLAQCSQEDLLSMLKNEMMIEVVDDDTL